MYMVSEIDDRRGNLMGLFEAARWAPSSYNNQPWRFIYAKKDTKHWEVLFNLLVEGNKACAKNASVLIVVIARKNFEFNEKPARTNQFDAGAAWENIALEATFRGLATHGMQGFDYEKARKDLEIPDNFDVLAMIAIGRRTFFLLPLCLLLQGPYLHEIMLGSINLSKLGL